MAIISPPITALTRKDRQQFNWSTECEEAFLKIKQLLMSAPLLYPPDLEENSFYGPMPVSKALVLSWNRRMGMVLDTQWHMQVSQQC